MIVLDVPLSIFTGHHVYSGCICSHMKLHSIHIGLTNTSSDFETLLKTGSNRKEFALDICSCICSH